MSVNLLDNPGWHALNSHHRHLAVWGEFAARYQQTLFLQGQCLKIRPQR